MRFAALSLETPFGALIGLITGLVELNWELRSLGVLFTTGLVVHIAKRIDANIFAKIAFATVAIGLLSLGTYHPIWVSFHEDFPTVAAEAALSRIIESGILVACGVASYIFVIRPSGKEGFRVLPAQLIAFGTVVMGLGFIQGCSFL